VDTVFNTANNNSIIGEAANHFNPAHDLTRHGMARPSILSREFSARGVSMKKCHKIPADKGGASPVLAVYLATCLATDVFLQFRLHCINVTAFVKLTYSSRPSTKGTSVQINRTDTRLVEISVISSQKQALVSHFENLPKALPEFVLTELWKEFQVKPTSRKVSLSLSLSLSLSPPPRPREQFLDHGDDSSPPKHFSCFHAAGHVPV